MISSLRAYPEVTAERVGVLTDQWIASWALPERERRMCAFSFSYSGDSNLTAIQFIDNLEGAGTHRAGHNLKSSTRTVTPWRLKGHAEFQDRIVFLDTPGFDDTSRTDMEILQEIATWLQKTYASRCLVARFI